MGGFQRKLAAILYADVASYSRLTSADEDGMHLRLSEYLDFIAREDDMALYLDGLRKAGVT